MRPCPHALSFTSCAGAVERGGCSCRYTPALFHSDSLPLPPCSSALTPLPQALQSIPTWSSSRGARPTLFPLHKTGSNKHPPQAQAAREAHGRRAHRVKPRVLQRPCRRRRRLGRGRHSLSAGCAAAACNCGTSPPLNPIHSPPLTPLTHSPPSPPSTQRSAGASPDASRASDHVDPDVHTAGPESVRAAAGVMQCCAHSLLQRQRCGARVEGCGRAGDDQPGEAGGNQRGKRAAAACCHM